MNGLDTNRINAKTPYEVTYDVVTDLYKFVSAYDVSFSVAFDENELLESGESYQFALTNYEGRKSLREK